MGRLLTKATWGMLPRAAFAFSDESCGAIVLAARLATRLARPVALRLRAGANRAVVAVADGCAAGAGGLCGCVAVAGADGLRS